MILLPVPDRFYLGQVRKRYAHTWETVTGRCNCPNVALSRARMCMQRDDFRARVILVDDSSHRGPVPLAELSA